MLIASEFTGLTSLIGSQEFMDMITASTEGAVASEALEARLQEAERANRIHKTRDLRETSRREKESVPAYLSIFRLAQHDNQGRIVAPEREIPIQTLPGLSREYRFLITNHSMPEAEVMGVTEVFGDDPAFLQSFGRQTRAYQFRGMLLNERGVGNWTQNFRNLYRDRIRATESIRRREIIGLRISDMLVRGYIRSLEISADSSMDDVLQPFAFSMIVRSSEYVSDSSASAATTNQGADLDAADPVTDVPADDAEPASSDGGATEIDPETNEAVSVNTLGTTPPPYEVS